MPNRIMDSVVDAWKPLVVPLTNGAAVAVMAGYSGPAPYQILLRSPISDIEISDEEAGTFVLIAAGQWFPMPVGSVTQKLWAKSVDPVADLHVIIQYNLQ